MAEQGPWAEIQAAPLSPLAWRQDQRADLAVIEAALFEAGVANDESLTEIALHLISAGGKRIRPALAATSGLVGAASSDPSDPIPDRLVQAAVAVELVHLGSLYHDDVIDGAETRRGVETVNHRWGDLKAILAGDFLLARASELASALGTEVAELLAETIGWLCEGQVRELNSVGDIDRTEAEYFDAIGSKTAALFATACRMGALVSGLNASEVEQLTEFGRSYGLAFQILDDVVDIVGTDDQTGKPTGVDMAAGVTTLPVIRHLRSTGGDELRDLLSRRDDPIALATARLLVANGPGVTDALSLGSEHAAVAVSKLTDIADGPATRGLRAAADGLSNSAATSIC